MLTQPLTDGAQGAPFIHATQSAELGHKAAAARCCFPHRAATHGHQHGLQSSLSFPSLLNTSSSRCRTQNLRKWFPLLASSSLIWKLPASNWNSCSAKALSAALFSQIKRDGTWLQFGCAQYLSLLSETSLTSHIARTASASCQLPEHIVLF